MAVSEAAFVARYGAIYEHSPWVAREAAAIVDDAADIEQVAAVMADCVDNASADRQLELVRAHPDLAGKAQVAADLTQVSRSEQASAGLEQSSAEEYERFQALNRAYREKFDFPFVMAVRGSNRQQILAVFAQRLNNDPALEFETALAEIHKIARLRLHTMEADT